jgi:alcohol dehydrogenase (NADP+)
MLPTRGYAADSPTSSLKPFDFERRDLKPTDILIEIAFCGVCHSDIHQVRDEWGGSIYPMVPGHEIVGRVAQTGADVSKFSEGDYAGVGCFVDSCRECVNCKEGVEQFCLKQAAMTYNGTEMDRKTPTFGGYSSQIVVDEKYGLKINDTENLAGVAPLLCAGITTYSPLRRFNVGKNQKVGVVGLGGLGHMGVKLAASMGAEVTVFSTSPSKEEDARKLGAHNFVVTKNPENMTPLAGTFDFILDTVSADHDLNMYLNVLKRGGAMVLVGAPEKPAAVSAFSLIGGNKTLAGSMIGSIGETQEMLDYCAENKILSEVEIIPIERIAEAYERTVKSDVRYRFVIDINSLKNEKTN